jgi:hypothetical protein
MLKLRRREQMFKGAVPRDGRRANNNKKLSRRLSKIENKKAGRQEDKEE